MTYSNSNVSLLTSNLLLFNLKIDATQKIKIDILDEKLYILDTNNQKHLMLNIPLQFIVHDTKVPNFKIHPKAVIRFSINDIIVEKIAYIVSCDNMLISFYSEDKIHYLLYRTPASISYI